MDSILNYSFIVRALRAVASIGRSGVTSRVLRAVGTAVRESLPGRAVLSLLASDAKVSEMSVVRRFFLWCNGVLHRAGQALDPAWERCLPRRAWLRARSSDLVCESAVLHRVFYPGMRRLLVLAFALYLPIDWALRDVLSWGLVASAWDEAFILVTILYLLGRRILGSERVLPVVTPLDAAIALFIGVGAALMFAVSPRFGIAFEGYRATVQNLIWFFLLLRLFEDKRDAVFLYRMMVVVGTAIALHGIYQFIIAVPIPSHWQTSTEVAVRTRVYSIIGSPNIMGSLMVMLAPMAAALAYGPGSVGRKAAAWVCTFLMCFACLFTFSRGAWLGMGIAVLIFALLVDRKLLILLAGAAAVAMMIPDVNNRIMFLFTEQFAEASKVGGRAARWHIGKILLHENSPILGFGLGRYGGATAMNNQVESRFSYYYLDNYYMRILVEMGYAGLVSYLIMLLTNVVTALRAIFRRRKNRPIAAMCSGMLSGMAGVMAHCLYENIFEEPYMMAYFWGMAAMVVFLGFLDREKGPVE